MGIEWVDSVDNTGIKYEIELINNVGKHIETCRKGPPKEVSVGL
jgi:hypothetical protein